MLWRRKGKKYWYFDLWQTEELNISWVFAKFVPLLFLIDKKKETDWSLWLVFNWYVS